MKEHKYAEVLRALADGVPLSEFEARPVNGVYEWVDLYHRAGDMIRFPDQWEIRRKSQYIMVNGFKVPKPLNADHKAMTVHVPRPDAFGYFDTYSEYGCRNAMQRGIAHASIEAAIAHAKAMLGLDPEAS